MARTALFDETAERLEQATSLNRLEARGTLRIALKVSGFDARSVTPDDLRIVLERVLPGLLVERGISDENEICHRLVHQVRQVATDSSGQHATPESVFARLGKG